MTSPWDPTAFEDTYTDVLRKAIQQKSEGKAIAAPAHERPPVVHDLMEPPVDGRKTETSRRRRRKAA